MPVRPVHGAAGVGAAGARPGRGWGGWCAAPGGASRARPGQGGAWPAGCSGSTEVAAGAEDLKTDKKMRRRTKKWSAGQPRKVRALLDTAIKF
jgi:hypothetical protein